MKRFPPILERVLLGCGLAVAFLFMASVFVPDYTKASDRLGTPMPTASTDPHAGLLSLGMIENDRYDIHIFAGEDGPLFSVYDHADQSELAVLLTADEVHRRFPDLPLPEMDFGTGPLMMVDDTF